MGGNISRRPMKAGRLGGLLQPGDILRSFGGHIEGGESIDPEPEPASSRAQSAAAAAAR